MWLDRLRLTCLASAILLYGALSSPTPADPGRREALIGLLLILAVGLYRPFLAVTGIAALDRAAPVVHRIGGVCFLVLLWIPSMRGLALGAQPTAMIRDLVPLLYLFAPLLFGRLLEGASAQRLIAAALAAAGVLFAVRFFLISGLDPTEIGRSVGIDRLLYLPNSPCVLFAAVGLGLFALRPGALAGPGSIVVSTVALAGSLACLGALAGTVQRGPLTLAVAAFGAFYLWRARRSALALLLGPAFVAAIGAALLDPIAGTISLLEEKTAQVGVNARQEEFAAVLDHIARNPLALLVGDGWGALIASPAVGGMRVGYTHTFASYLLLKAGFVGLIGYGAYAVLLMRVATATLGSSPMIAFATLPPLLLGLAVMTSFKFLDFGLLLALVVGAGVGRERDPKYAQRGLEPATSAC